MYTPPPQANSKWSLCKGLGWNGPRFLLIWKELDLESFRIAKTQSSAGSGPMGSSRGRRGGSHLHPSWKVSHPIDMPFWCHSWFYQIPLERSPALTKPNPLLPPLSKERHTCQLKLPGPQNPILLKSLSHYHSFCQTVLTDWHKGKRKLFAPFLPSISICALLLLIIIINSFLWNIPDST